MHTKKIAAVVFLLAGYLSAQTAVVRHGSDYCAPASASGTAYTCTLTPTLAAYVTGQQIILKPDTNNTASATLAIDGLAAITMQKISSGALANLAANDLDSDGTYLLIKMASVFVVVPLEAAAAGGSGDVVGPSSSVDSEVALFNSTTGKLLKSATGTGFAKLTSGVLSAGSIAAGDLPTRTARVSLLNGSVFPDTSGEAYFESYSTLATNDVWHGGVWRFGSNNAAQPTVRACIAGSLSLPWNTATTVATASAVITWTGTGTTGNVVWDFDYRIVGGNDTTSLDQAGTGEAVTVTDAMPGATDRRLTASAALTAGNFSAQANNTFQWKACRDGADAADTAAFSALAHDVQLEVTVQ